MKVNSDVLRIYKTLHTWVGLSAGLLLFIGFFAGSLTMFKQSLDCWIAAPQQLASVVAAQRESLVNQLVAKYPSARTGFTLYLTQQENITAPIIWSESEEGRELSIASPRWHATLDAQGQLHAEKIQPSLLGELVDLLHRTGGIPGFVGHDYAGVYILGVAAVLYFLALVSGVILLLPTLVKDFFALRPGQNRKRFWLDAHNVIGISSLPYHMVISLTVIVFAFHDQLYDAIEHAVYRDQPMFTRAAAPKESWPIEKLLSPEVLVARFQAAAPGYQVTELLYRNLETPRAGIRAIMVNPEQMVHGPIGGYMVINPFTGVITDNSMLPETGNSWSVIVSSFFALHFGSYGGNLMRWVYFLMGLSGAFLFYSGNLLWIESRRKQQRGNSPVVQSRSTRLMASATLGVSLGAIMGIGAALVVGKWLFAHIDNINHGYLTVYYMVFLSAVAWAFWRGPGRASVHLLGACAGICLAIPLTSLLAFVISNLWINTSLASLAVDAVALVFAIVFAWAARLAWRRAYFGPADSVWAVQKQEVIATVSDEVHLADGELQKIT